MASCPAVDLEPDVISRLRDWAELRGRISTRGIFDILEASDLSTDLQSTVTEKFSEYKGWTPVRMATPGPLYNGRHDMTLFALDCSEKCSIGQEKVERGMQYNVPSKTAVYFVPAGLFILAEYSP